MVRVMLRTWAMHNVYESPQKDRNTYMRVCGFTSIAEAIFHHFVIGSLCHIPQTLTCALNHTEKKTI